ncbi:MAG: hypothetical protein LC118_03765 [Dehalococcoidia bacterium]|nr:hypothetical protein [Dehalococcoidia bacterium]
MFRARGAVFRELAEVFRELGAVGRPGLEAAGPEAGRPGLVAACAGVAAEAHPVVAVAARR